MVRIVRPEEQQRYYAVCHINSDELMYIGTSSRATAWAMVVGTCWAWGWSQASANWRAWQQAARFRLLAPGGVYKPLRWEPQPKQERAA